MQEFQKNLVAAWTDFVAGRIDAKALKGQSAGFGIYQQGSLGVYADIVNGIGGGEQGLAAQNDQQQKKRYNSA